MSLCACGCGEEIVIKPWYKWRGIPKYITGHNNQFKKGNQINKGRHQSKETIEKRSISNSGKHRSEEQKKNISDNHADFSKENHPRWKGGYKLKCARSNASRRGFSHINLNDCEQDGWVGHHIDYNYVIYIPEELHKSIYHSVTKDVNMDLINDKVYEWFVNYYGLI